jgi:adenine-specific DNA methylase
MSCRFEVSEGNQIDFDASKGTVQKGKAACPFCHMIVDGNTLRSESKAKRMGQQLMAIVTGKEGDRKKFRSPTDSDITPLDKAGERLAQDALNHGPWILLDEPISRRQPRLMWVTRYGISKWSDLLNPRQALSMSTFARLVRSCGSLIENHHEPEYSKAVRTYLGIGVDEIARFTTTLNPWKADAEAINHMWGRQGLPMVWDYCENNVIGEHGGTWQYRLQQFMGAVKGICLVEQPAKVVRGSATAIPFDDESIALVVTDPPYYDAVPYSDLSDFFYVWLKRTVGDAYPDSFRTPLTPKQQELIEERPHSSIEDRKDKAFYERGMEQAFREAYRVLDNGI